MEKFLILAQGSSQIYRTLDDNVFDLAIAKIPASMNPPVEPLDVMDFVKFFQNIGKAFSSPIVTHDSHSCSTFVSPWLAH